MNNIYPEDGSSAMLDTGANSLSTLVGLNRLIPRLDALLMVTKSCKGATCVSPWSVLHPDGDVRSLTDALHERFDGFYAFVGERVKFDRCELGYIKESEGPQAAMQFGVDCEMPSSSGASSIGGRVRSTRRFIGKIAGKGTVLE